MNHPPIGGTTRNRRHAPRPGKYAQLKLAVTAYFKAEYAFLNFERDQPNDATRRWEAVFEARNAAHDRLRELLGIPPWQLHGDNQF